MDRQEYPAMLATLQPNQAVDVLQDRVRQVGSLNAHIADWLQERRRLEDQYSGGLRKLARRPPPGDANELGIFSVPWSTLTNSLETMADSHHAFATKIETDVEKPLRDFFTHNREMQGMTTIQGNLASLARDIENAQKRNERLAHKGQKAKTQNVANATNDLDQAQSLWDNQAPYVFEQLQAVDETRLNQLRDVLTQYQTHEVDRVERDRTLSEQCLNILLNVETADEIKTFALRTSQGTQARPATMQTQRSSRQSVIGSSAPALAAPTPHFAAADDAASQRSGSIQNEPEKKSGGLKGLKRLGTVLGRRRESKIMLPNRGGSESPERQPKGNSAFNTFAGRFGRGRDLPTPLEDDETPHRPRSPLRTMTSSSTAPASPSVERSTGPIDGTAQSLAAAGLLPNGHDTSTSHQSDVAQLQEPLQPSASESIQPVSSEPEAPRDNDGYSMPPSRLDAISQAERDAAEAGDGTSPAFNVNIRQNAIAEDDDDVSLATLAKNLKMQAPPPVSRRAGTIRGRRDVRASVYSPSPSADPVYEESVSSSPNMAPPVSATREIGSAISPAPAAASGFAPPPAISGLAPPPSDAPAQASAVPKQTFQPTPLSVHPAPSPLASVPQSPTSPTTSSPGAARGGLDSSFSPFHGSAAAVAATVFGRPSSSVGGHGAFDNPSGDSHSIRSGRSLSSSTSQGVSKHATDLAGPGINASIIETVSAWFEHGLCTRSIVLGEVGLLFNPTATSASQETIRLEGFEKLEKVAPNPAFIAEAGAKGEYSVATAPLARMNVAFKYQLAPLPGSSSGELAPLLLTTAWKIEKGTAMCILSYSLNPTFALSGSNTTVEVKNLTLVLHLGADGARAASCMSKPVGTFDRTRNIIYWNLGDVALASGAAPTKLLAKFGTVGDAEAKQGHVEAKWEVVGGVGSGLEICVRNDEVDPFADDERAEAVWKSVESKRKMIAGTYHAQ